MISVEFRDGQRFQQLQSLIEQLCLEINPGVGRDFPSYNEKKIERLEIIHKEYLGFVKKYGLFKDAARINPEYKKAIRKTSK